MCRGHQEIFNWELRRWFHIECVQMRVHSLFKAKDVLSENNFTLINREKNIEKSTNFFTSLRSWFFLQFFHIVRNNLEQERKLILTCLNFWSRSTTRSSNWHWNFFKRDIYFDVWRKIRVKKIFKKKTWAKNKIQAVRSLARTFNHV